MSFSRRAVLAAAIVCLSLSAAAAVAAPTGRVINGRDAQSTEPAVTSMVAIGFADAPSAWDSFNCGGTLVAPTVVVTARHCVDNSPFVRDAAELTVFRGPGPNLEMPKKGWRGVDTTKVVSVHRSPGANAQSFDRGGDIAILRLASQLPGTVPIGYAHPGDEAWFAPRSTGVTLYGWGATVDYNERTGANAGGYPTKLQTVDMPIVSQSTCLQSANFPKVAVNYLCAGTPGAPSAAKSSCYGDSGGPLFAADPAGDPASPATERRLVGVVSHGDDDRCGGAYTRYVRVVDWAAWIDGFVASQGNAPSGTAAPVIKVAKRVKKGLQIIPSAVTVGPAPTRLMVLYGGSGSGLLQQGTVGPNGGIIDAPPSRTGKLKLQLRALDAAGNESASSGVKTVPTAKDRTKPRIAKLTARSLGKGRWKLAWTKPVEADRVVSVFIEARKGKGKWIDELVFDCFECWTSKKGIPTASVHFALAGKWQFRIRVMDRAGNVSIATVSK